MPRAPTIINGDRTVQGVVAEIRPLLRRASAAAHAAIIGECEPATNAELYHHIAMSLAELCGPKLLVASQVIDALASIREPTILTEGGEIYHG